jgi:hypothetical protein
MHRFEPMSKSRATGLFAETLRRHRREVDFEEQEALLRSYERSPHGISAAPQTTFHTAAAATPPHADGIEARYSDG